MITSTAREQNIHHHDCGFCQGACFSVQTKQYKTNIIPCVFVKHQFYLQGEMREIVFIPPKTFSNLFVNTH